MFVLRTGVIKKEVHIDNKFISATIFLKEKNYLVYTMGGLKNRPTVRLITWLIVTRCSGQKGCSSRTSLSDFLQSLAFLIFIQRHFPGTITWKLFDFYWHKEEIFLKRTPEPGGGGYSLQWPIRGCSAQKEYLIWASCI